MVTATITLPSARTPSLPVTLSPAAAARIKALSTPEGRTLM